MCVCVRACARLQTIDVSRGATQQTFTDLSQERTQFWIRENTGEFSLHFMSQISKDDSLLGGRLGGGVLGRPSQIKASRLRSDQLGPPGPHRPGEPCVILRNHKGVE